MPIIVLALIFAGFIVYNSFIKKPASTSLLKTTSQISSSTPESNFLPILIEVQGVTLDEKLFLDPVFRALVDFSQPIVPESLGKANPFSGSLSGGSNSSVESLGFVDTSTTTPAKANTKKK